MAREVSEAGNEIQKRVLDKLLLLVKPGEKAAGVTGIIGAPLVCLAAMQVQLALVPFACWHGWKIALHITTIVGVAMVGAFGYLAWRNWRAAGETVPGDTDSPSDRTRFLAWIGLGSSGLSAIAIAGQAIANSLLSPCN